MDGFEAPLHSSAPSGPLPSVVRHGPVSVDADRDFEDLYREHADRLWRAVFAYGGDSEVASDAVSEAFAQCLARGSAVRSPGRWV